MSWEAWLGIAGSLLAILFGYAAFSRGRKTDDTADGRQTGAILSELASVRTNTEDIKLELREQRKLNTDVYCRLSAVEASAKQAHKRIDRLDGSPGRE